jgi:hypothetical protein
MTVDLKFFPLKTAIEKIIKLVTLILNKDQELALLALLFLVLPHSNAEVERLFSQMNLINSKLRNRMQLYKVRDESDRKIISKYLEIF